LQSEVVFVTESIGAPLDGADLVVQALDKTQGDFVLFMAISLDAVPVALDQSGKLFKGFEPLPFESVSPVAEEASRPEWQSVFPKLVEGFFEKVSGVYPFVGLEQN